jgi:hypothetical protein
MFSLQYSRVFKSILLLSTTFAIMPTCIGQATIPLRVTFTLDNEQVPLHDLVKVSVKITNDDMEHTYTVDLGADRERAFTLTIKKPDGTTSQFIKSPSEGLHRIGKIAIEPKATYTQDLTLNQWFDFSAPGNYHIILSLDAQVNSDSSGSLTGTLNTNVDISAPDTASLNSQCEHLLEVISSSNSYQDAADAAKSLSSIKDPIAVTYLVEGAKIKPILSYILIPGLQRLGTADAVDGLLSLAKSRDSDTKLLATRSLNWIEQSEQDPAIKGRIRSGLAESSQH